MLSKIIHARLVEIIDQVYIEIKNYGHEEGKKKLIAGIVLTGGGSQLKHIKQLFEYETGMDTRVGFPNEHLANGSRSDIESPMYATAVGLVMKGVELNERNLKVNVKPDNQNNPIDRPIGDLIDESINENQTHKEAYSNPKESYIDKWATALLKLLANEKIKLSYAKFRFRYATKSILSHKLLE